MTIRIDKTGRTAAWRHRRHLASRRATASTACAALFLALPGDALTQGRAFSGPYFGVEAARQNMIGGSLVGGVDVLEQESRAVAGVVGGLRHHFPWGLVVGAEGSYALVDGDLAYSDEGTGLAIEYLNDRQHAYGVTVGLVVGGNARWLAFGYVNEVTRDFDVTVRQSGSTVRQQDEQGMLRFGVGVEGRAIGRLHVRASVGTGRADFGDRETNIDAEHRTDIGLAAIIQL